MVNQINRKSIRIRPGFAKDASGRYRPTVPNFLPEKHQSFSAALTALMAEHGLSVRTFGDAVDPGGPNRRSAVWGWCSGTRIPTHKTTFQFFEKAEVKYALPLGYFRNLLLKEKCPTQKLIDEVNPNDRGAVRAHLPADFDKMDEKERTKVTRWIRENILPGTTNYSKYLSEMGRVRYSMCFPNVTQENGGRRASEVYNDITRGAKLCGGTGTISAPKYLADEMTNLVEFKTSSLPMKGFRRYSRWAAGSTFFNVRRYGELFGALAANPDGPAHGYGVPLSKLTFGLLVFPAVWDWYICWREARRGFLTITERSSLYEAKLATRHPDGWILQHPELVKRLRPIKGLLSKGDIAEAKKDWAGACLKVHFYAADAITGLRLNTKTHRDTLFPIMPVLASKRPLNEYKKIADEILCRMPSPRREPAKFALAVRAYLMVRLSIHLGFRQRNLRELLVCPKGSIPRTVNQLVDARRAEIRWSDEDKTWRVFAPSAAFKNYYSSYFKGLPYHTTLPNIDGLYFWIKKYLNVCRPILLQDFVDPGTFFVRELDSRTKSASMTAATYYESWNLITRQYGIYNPFTKRGAIKGLLAHGPHSVRDVLATHVLKVTGSYELAGFAIQDNPRSVMNHYARFMPHEKAERVAAVINKVWQ